MDKVKVLFISDDAHVTRKKHIDGMLYDCWEQMSNKGNHYDYIFIDFGLVGIGQNFKKLRQLYKSGNRLAWYSGSGYFIKDYIERSFSDDCDLWIKKIPIVLLGWDNVKEFINKNE
jgi:hypothetical protein